MPILHARAVALADDETIRMAFYPSIATDLQVTPTIGFSLLVTYSQALLIEEDLKKPRPPIFVESVRGNDRIVKTQLPQACWDKHDKPLYSMYLYDKEVEGSRAKVDTELHFPEMIAAHFNTDAQEKVAADIVSFLCYHSFQTQIDLLKYFPMPATDPAVTAFDHIKEVVEPVKRGVLKLDQSDQEENPNDVEKKPHSQTNAKSEKKEERPNASGVTQDAVVFSQGSVEGNTPPNGSPDNDRKKRRPPTPHPSASSGGMQNTPDTNFKPPPPKMERPSKSVRRPPMKIHTNQAEIDAKKADDPATTGTEERKPKDLPPPRNLTPTKTGPASQSRKESDRKTDSKERSKERSKEESDEESEELQEPTAQQSAHQGGESTDDDIQYMASIESICPLCRLPNMIPG
eukprot:Platyproteum_vivax@DN3294_c0_g1_i1.p1